MWFDFEAMGKERALFATCWHYASREVHPMRLLVVCELAILLVASIFCLSAQNVTPAPLSADQILAKVSPSVVLVQAGRGDGRVAAFSSGLIVNAEGVVLTTHHAVEGMSEAQGRLGDGEIYDRVELIVSDERRDVAALRIPASGLPALPLSNLDKVQEGAPVYTVTNGAGLRWTVIPGTLVAVRMADQVPGAGNGYRLLQFKAPLPADSAGGILVDSQAQALGIVVAFNPEKNVNFAVPVENVMGLAAFRGGTPFFSRTSFCQTRISGAMSFRSESFWLGWL